MRDDRRRSWPIRLLHLRGARVALMSVAAAAATILLSAESRVVGAGPQVFKTPGGRAENVRVERSAGEVVTISYDLASDDVQAVFTVVLFVSQDGGKTFDLRPKSVAGDVGSGVHVGRGKKIVWQAGRDVESVEMDLFRFSIRTEAANAKPVAAPAPPAPKPAPTPTASPEKEKKGSSMKWVLPLAAVGAAAGVAVAVKGGGSSGSSGGGSTTPPPVVYTDSLTITDVSPASGSTINAGKTTILPGTGLISVTINISTSKVRPYANLQVYLLKNNATREVWALNLPDSKSWQDLPAGSQTVTVSGFQIYQGLPITVTGILAIFSTYQGYMYNPPAANAAETIAEGMRALTYQVK
jgi:hypothetical protein